MPIRFDCFGELYAIERDGGRWRAWIVGAEGKRRPASFEIPEFIAEGELEEFLFDMLHERARPGRELRRLA